MERKLVFDIAIESNGPAVHLSSETGAVDMIPFGGTVRGRYSRVSWSPAGWTPRCSTRRGCAT